MSEPSVTPLRDTIATRMTGDSGIAAVLAEDPLVPSRPAVLAGTFDGVFNGGTPVYPCLTYRLRGALDGRFRAPLVEGHSSSAGASPMEDVTLEIEAWSQAKNSRAIEVIRLRLQALFENTAFAVPGLGRVHQSEETLADTDHYDAKYKARLALFRYKLHLYKTT